MSDKAKQIMKRYQKGYVTEEQLLKYLSIGAITEDEYYEIVKSKS